MEPRRGARLLLSVICMFALCVRVLFPAWRVFLFHLQDWWVDQHGDQTWHVPSNQWRKAARYTDWACESLSGPVGVEDLLGHFVSRLHYFVCWWLVQCVSLF